jgi:hypothetical protein
VAGGVGASVDRCRGDMYVAHGDPSLHGVEIYKGRPIFYSLGNFIFQSPLSLIVVDTYGPLAYMRAIAQVEFHSGRVFVIHYVPIVLSMNDAGKPHEVCRIWRRAEKQRRFY